MRATLSLFNGVGVGIQALKNLGVSVGKSYICEVDKYANATNEKNHPESIQLGDVTKWREWDIDWSEIDLVTAGFPCQSWSMAGQQMGDKDERGALFWTTLDIIQNVLKHNYKAKWLMENVKMKRDFEEYITKHTTDALFYVEKTLINSALVTAQNRNRYYWSNFYITQPDDRGILLRDIVECEQLPGDLRDLILKGSVHTEQRLDGTSQTLDRALSNGKNPDDKGGTITKCAYKGMGTNGMSNVLVKVGALRGRYIKDGKRQDHLGSVAGKTTQRLELRSDDKSNTLTTVQKDNVLVLENESAMKNGKSYSLTASYNGAVAWNSCERKQRTMIPVGESDKEDPNVYNGLLYRKLTPLECERLQGFPDNYTEGVSNTQRYKQIGNAWTLPVIEHIFKEMLK